MRIFNLLGLCLVLSSPITGQELELETRPLIGLRADVAALILGGGASGSLGAGPLQADTVGVPGEEEYDVDFLLELDGPSLLEGQPDGAGDLRLELHAYVLTRSGELETTLDRRIRLPSASLDESLRSGGIRLDGHLEASGDEVQLRVLVRETRTQRFVLRLVNLEKPELGSQSGEAGPHRLADSPTLRALVVADLELRPRPESALPEPDLSGRRIRKRIAAIAAAYREILGRLAEGKTADAVDGLRGLEREALGLDPKRSRGSQWLTAGVDRVIDEIAAGSPDSLLPILFLHTEVHNLYLRDGIFDPFLMNPTRHRILDLASRFARGVDTQPARSLASSVLADTGVTLDQAKRPAGARRMLEAALELDGRNPTALLNLAYWHERRGEYTETVARLRGLLEIVPRSPEGSLRLALSLGHLGRRDEQKAILRRLIRESSEEWLITIAYQELGELLLHEERLEEARQLLEDGVARLPAQQRLYIQLAFILDRSGRSRTALAVVDRIPEDSGISPRHLYSRRRRGDDPVRADLLRQSTARLPALAAELARLGRRK